MNEENELPKTELMSKYLAGEATPEEAMQLHELIYNQEYKDEYNKLNKLWDLLPNTSIIHVPRVEEGWKELDKKIKHSEQFKTKKLVFSHIAVAASILGLILMVSYTWFIGIKSKRIAVSKQPLTILRSTKDKVRTNTLSDGSVVVINKNSSVAYSPAFNKINRKISLSGECYFNVVPDKTRPFIIAIEELKIKVVGTSFNVRYNSAGSRIEVQVQSGTVKMYTSDKEITIITGQTGIYSKHDGSLNVKDTFDINSVGYATKAFSFNDLSFIEACGYIETAFNVVIKFDKQKFAACRLSAEFNNKSLDYILNIISATLNSSYKKQGDTIYILGEGCL
jgi:ferric-dicitrate binding protein FerR (iron transport regulator)